MRALHEPERRAPARRGMACPECADLEIGAPSPRFKVPMRARIDVEAFQELRNVQRFGCRHIFHSRNSRRSSYFRRMISRSPALFARPTARSKALFAVAADVARLIFARKSGMFRQPP